MVSASKILTVSYGTFSCTLEGFDDPFNTMKAIAEYFRDLAAEDRFFGAEPPVPDAEMLHRIAEREIERRVETRVKDNNVTLRAIPASAQAERAAAPAPSPKPVPVPASSLREDDAGDIPLPAATDASESVAAKLLRIRAAVAQSREAAPAPRKADAAAEPAAEAAHRPVDPETGKASERTAAPVAPVIAAAAAAVEEAAGEFTKKAPAEEITPAAEASAPVEETVADLPSEDAEEPEADEGAMLAAITAATSAAPATEEPAASLADIPEEAPLADAPEAGPDTRLEDSISSLMASTSADEATKVEGQAADEAQETAEEKPAVRARARVIKVRRIEVDGRTQAETYVADAVSEAAAPAEAAPEPVAAEAAPESETPAAEEVKADAGALSPEDEADLMAELAAVEREVAIARGDAPQDEAAAPESEKVPEPAAEAEAAPEAVVAKEPEAQRSKDHDGRALLKSRVEDEDQAMDRLLQQADSELSTSENRRRQDAFTHLKAAVAATKAEQEMAAEDGAADAGKSELDRYRDDLAQAVRPRRPIAGTASTSRPVTPAERPAPLVLVSEQRIDRPNAEPTVIRPRRVTSGNLALSQDEDDSDEDGEDDGNFFADSRSFAEFAERIGATELPDLLEAAAAYAACVEGKPHFSRPQIMRSAASIAPEEEFNREDGMRSFGILLRQGKIQKLKRGQFMISDSSRFVPEARKIAK